MAKKKIAAFSIIGILAIISVSFFAAEHFLADGWYYIPEKANTVASIPGFIWSCVAIGAVYFVLSSIKNKAGKVVVTVIAAVIVFAVIIILVWNCILYSADHMEKVEQYDE